MSCQFLSPSRGGRIRFCPPTSSFLARCYHFQGGPIEWAPSKTHEINNMALATVGTAGIFAGVNALTEVIMKEVMPNGSSEIKRHNLEIEAFNQKRELYQEKEKQRLDFINKTLQEQHHAQQTFSDLDAAMEQYYEITKQRLPPLVKPRIEDFVRPSEGHKNIDLAVTAVVVVFLGVGGIYAYKRYYKKHR